MIVKKSKICPKCKSLNHVSHQTCPGGCGYVFTGSEEGAPGKTATLVIKDTILNDGQIKQHLSGLGATRPSGSVLETVKSLLSHLGIGLGMAAVGALILEGVGSNILSPWLGELHATLVNLFGLALAWTLLPLGVLFAVISFVQILCGPDLRDPAGTVRTFFSEGIFAWPCNFWFAWCSITPQARADFKSLQDFKIYWRKQIDYLVNHLPIALGVPCTMTDWKWNVENTFQVKEIQVMKEGRTAQTTFTVSITQKRSYNDHTDATQGYEIEYGTLNLNIVKYLVQSDNGQWFFVDGHLALPKLDTAVST